MKGIITQIKTKQIVIYVKIGKEKYEFADKFD